MKNARTGLLLILFSTLFISQVINGSAGTADTISLEKYRKELTGNLKEDILGFWSKEMTDNARGGFYGRIDNSGKVYHDDDKGGILNARILWTYSSAFRLTGDSVYLKTARRALDYNLKYFIDNEYGGAFRSVKADGKPSDTRKQTYTQSFFIYGFSEYYRVSGDHKALSAATDLYHSVEDHAADHENGGYFEVFTRDWVRTHDKLISEKSDLDEKTMNTHLHLLEAYTALYRVWPDSILKTKLQALVDIFINRITDRNRFHLISFLDKKWNKTSETDSYGHDIEASWLLCEAGIVLNDPALLSSIKMISLKIADAAAEGIQDDGSMIDEYDYVTGHKSRGRSWWPQAESVVGFFNAWELSGERKYLDRSLRSWEYIKLHFVDYKNGGWYSSLNDDGTPGRGDKAGFWVCPYHNGRMCMEIMERIENHLN